MATSGLGIGFVKQGVRYWRMTIGGKKEIMAARMR